MLRDCPVPHCGAKFDPAHAQQPHMCRNCWSVLSAELRARVLAGAPGAMVGALRIVTAERGYKGSHFNPKTMDRRARELRRQGEPV